MKKQNRRHKYVVYVPAVALAIALGGMNSKQVHASSLHMPTMQTKQVLNITKTVMDNNRLVDSIRNRMNSATDMGAKGYDEIKGYSGFRNANDTEKEIQDRIIMDKAIAAKTDEEFWALEKTFKPTKGKEMPKSGNFGTTKYTWDKTTGTLTLSGGEIDNESFKKWIEELDAPSDAESNNFNSQLKYIYLGGDNLVKHIKVLDTVTLPKDSSEMFEALLSLEDIDLSKFDASKLENAENMFNLTFNLKSIDISSWQTPNLTNISHMFARYTNYKSQYPTETIEDEEYTMNIYKSYIRHDKLRELKLNEGFLDGLIKESNKTVVNAYNSSLKNPFKNIHNVNSLDYRIFDKLFNLIAEKNPESLIYYVEPIYQLEGIGVDVYNGGSPDRQMGGLIKNIIISPYFLLENSVRYSDSYTDIDKLLLDDSKVDIDKFDINNVENSKPVSLSINEMTYNITNKLSNTSANIALEEFTGDKIIYTKSSKYTPLRFNSIDVSEIDDTDVLERIPKAEDSHNNELIGKLISIGITPYKDLVERAKDKGIYSSDMDNALLLSLYMFAPATIAPGADIKDTPLIYSKFILEIEKMIENKDKDGLEKIISSESIKMWELFSGENIPNKDATYSNFNNIFSKQMGSSDSDEPISIPEFCEQILSEIHLEKEYLYKGYTSEIILSNNQINSKINTPDVIDGEYLGEGNIVIAPTVYSYINSDNSIGEQLIPDSEHNALVTKAGRYVLKPKRTDNVVNFIDKKSKKSVKKITVNDIPGNMVDIKDDIPNGYTQINNSKNSVMVLTSGVEHTVEIEKKPDIRKAYTVNIHKRQGTENQVNGTDKGPRNTGEKIDSLENPDSNSKLNDNKTPLEGITFTATRIKPTGKVSAMDINNSASYERIENDDTNTSIITNDQGNATFNLKTGYYIIHEVARKDKSINVGKDFILALPMTAPNGSILNEINLYIKNHIDENEQHLSINKQINGKAEQNLAVGDKASWTIGAHVPATVYSENIENTPERFGQFKMQDPIVDNLSLIKDSIKGSVYTTAGVKEIDLTADDYVVSTVNTKGNEHSFNMLNISLSHSGIKKAFGKDVKFSFDTTINKMAVDGNKKPLGVENTLTVYADNANKGIPDLIESSNTETPEVKDPTIDNNLVPVNPTPDVDGKTPDNTKPLIKIGRVDIQKVDNDDTKTLLENAEFTIYEDKELTKPVKRTAGMTGSFADKVNVGDTVVIRTDGNGIAHFEGMANGQKYYIKETKAPDNYLLSDDIFSVTADMNTTAETVIKDNKDVFANYLPITGSQLRIALMTAGSVMIIGFTSALYVSKRKQIKDL